MYAMLQGQSLCNRHGNRHDSYGAALAKGAKQDLAGGIATATRGLPDRVCFTVCSALMLCCAGSALAPATAMAAMGQPQPSLQSFQKGSDGNFNPTIQDWVTAYKPVDKALNKVFETRIDNNNARQVQWNLAVVRFAPMAAAAVPVSLSCMVASGRLAAGIPLSWPKSGKRQQQCKPALAGSGSGARLQAQRPLAGRPQCYGH